MVAARGLHGERKRVIPLKEGNKKGNWWLKVQEEPRSKTRRAPIRQKARVTARVAHKVITRVMIWKTKCDIIQINVGINVGIPG